MMNAFCLVGVVLLGVLGGTSLKELPLRPPKHGGVYVVAHRGAHQGIPENTLAAYQRAIDLGCDFVEIDLRTTRDGRFVSIHNDTVDAYTEDAKGPVRDFTLEELRALDIGMSALSFETVKRLEKNIRTARRGRRFPVGEGLHIEIDRETFFLFDNLPDSRIEAPLDTDIELPSGMGVMRISRNNGKNRVPFDGGRLSLRPSAPGDITDSGIKLRRHLMRKGIPHLIRDTAPVLFSGNVPLFFPPVGPLAKNPSLFELFVDYDGPLDILFNRER